MKTYITHHGQVDDSVKTLVCQLPLTDLGRQQATRLGEYLKHREFAGKIYTLPGVCTTETAEIIASFTGSEVILWDELNCPENELQGRIKSELERLSLSEDVLFVGYKETHQAMGKLFELKVGKVPCNCSLSVRNMEGKSVYAEPSHMPYKMRGDNMLMKSETDAKMVQNYIEQDLAIFEEIAKEKGTKILHISDTQSYVYPYVEKMIEVVKPNIIIHTGDFVDEVKAGRMINTRDEYEAGVEKICTIIANSGAEQIYAICGNNDIFEIVNKYLPDAEVSMPGNRVGICGIDCLLAHGPSQIEGDFEWAFYGHGLTGEIWSPEKNNTKEGVCRFNAIWNFSVIVMPERRHYVIGHPAYRD